MPKDLEIAFNAIKAKSNWYDKLFAYYDGDQPLIYSTRKLKQIFNKIDVKFIENWCGVVIDAVVDRIELLRFEVTDTRAQTRLSELWTQTEMNLDSYDAHLASVITGESFVIAWKGEDGIESYYNDPRMCHMEYMAAKPRKKEFAAKIYTTGDNDWWMVLYHPDRIDTYFVTKKNNLKASDFKLDRSEPNEHGQIPVFHLRRERRKIKGELDLGIISLQDAINKLLSDMMVAAEFGAFKQRYIISQIETQGKLKNSPNEIWDIPAGDGIGQDTAVGEFSPTELSNYLDALDRLSSTLAIITRTPKHFVYKQGGDPSGEALIALEAPLNDKCTKYINRFKVPWQGVGQFLLMLDGVTVDKNDITPIFERPETVQPLTRANIRKTNRDAGVPVRTTLRTEEGWSQEQINRYEADVQAEQAAQQQTLASAVLDAQRRMDGGAASNGLEQGTAGDVAPENLDSIRA